MPERAASVAAIALGANLGNREQALASALERIGLLGRVVSVSRFVDTAPVGYLDQPRFLNGVLLLETELSPLKLLHALLRIEAGMGRDRGSVPAKGPRRIDLDLIFYGQLVLETPELTLPHSAMHERAFVLEPLAEVAPGWIHPVLGESVLCLLRSLQDSA